MKIYTKTGDEGKTFMPGEGKVNKYDRSVDAQGEIDELNAWIGMIRHSKVAIPCSPEDMRDKAEFEAKLRDPQKKTLRKIQVDLYQIGAQLAQCEQRIRAKDIELLENEIDNMEEQLPALTNFILPSYPAAFHVARAVCRRAERVMSAWMSQYEDKEKFNLVIPYLNRLSDYLFILARHKNHISVAKEEVWDGKRYEDEGI